MLDNYEHYISKNIQAFYKRKLLAPILYLLLLIILWFLFPLKDMMSPMVLSDPTQIYQSHEDEESYIRCTFTDLQFTGYTQEGQFQTNGYYYYTMIDDKCLIVLLTPSTCDEGIPGIKSATVTGKLMEGKSSFDQLLGHLAKDLDWTEEGISSQMGDFYFSEPDYHIHTTVIVMIAYLGTFAYALISLILYLIYIRFPATSPCCQNLIIFGSPKEILAEAEEELATLPQLATEDMFITEHYFIVTSPLGNAIVPIQEILWIYKHSTLHKFLWYHFSISYTLHITAKKHFYIRCPKNIKSDIDGIIDYLAEANHDILVGFSEKNRLQAQADLGKPFHIEKFAALLRKKV
ncbi:MAG: hypothetical protein J6B26_05690 [Agathobacter sp.]|nr:hypothetical protein [Agathobacter sp.]MBQ2283628.1 hypothetical protein [Agathobacter sp.]